MAHVEPYNTFEEAINRRKFLRDVKKIFVVSGPASGPIRFITLAPSGLKLLVWITR